MVHGRTMFGVGRLGRSLAFVVMSALTACAGKSERNNEDGNNGNGGGSSARGGTSGSGGKGGTATGGRNSNVSVTRATQTAVDKIDLLFMIDNSISMADKQQILAEAVPVLVRRLVDPICTDDEGNPSGDSSSADGCTPGMPEFPPITNIHIGVITSSLGSHGGDVCVPDPNDPTGRTLNDQAQLVASMRTGLYSYASQGFLVWDPRTGQSVPIPDPHPVKGMNETSIDQFVTDFTSHVTAAGERGCGYEASLEAWYRFLIDPEPIATVTADPTVGFSVRGPINQVVLDQRRLFMRPDSLLAIVMLTDENDCSIDDENNRQGWLVGRRMPMVRSTSSCANPSDPCCRPCVVPPTGGCPDNAADPECARGDYLEPIEDSTNLRCFKQAQRFGVNLLYPWERYANALKQPRIESRELDANGNPQQVPNPIFTPGVDGTPAREAGLVFLVGIVGVPWQDIATPDSLTGPNLTYLTSSELATSSPNRWDVILGDPDQGRAPLDPFMMEQVDPRTGTNPITGDMILPPTPGTGGNDINGHEQNIVNRDDLQYACTFDLAAKPCNMNNQDGCDCNASEEAYNRSLCEYPGGGADGTQIRAKAYPGVRHLQVLKSFGDNAIVASICPKDATNQGSASYGYNPAVAAMIRRFKEALVGTCLPRPFAPESSGQIPCSVVETRFPDGGGGCSCSLPGRSNLGSEEIAGAIEEELIALSLCGGATGVECSDYCMCEIEQFSGSELQTCQLVPSDPLTQYGFCYVDESSGDPALLANCPATQRQIIRFMGADVPAPRSIAFVACEPE
jgi:hypothetical protein